MQPLLTIQNQHMKKLIFCLFAVSIICTSMMAQDITGDWYGKIAMAGQHLRLTFHIQQNADSTYSGTMDSPDQQSFDIPIDKITYQNGELYIGLLNIEIHATMNKKGDLDGKFKQSIIKTELYMTHTEIAPTITRRPQEPKKPYPYYCEEVSFQGGGNYLLAGTLVKPKQEGNYPIAVLISGSGPQNRDEEIFNHKPFLVIADYFARHGIATLRYDDRGTAASGGDFIAGTTEDNARDAAAAVAFLRDKDFDFIGLIGHSEGGIIAPMVAAQDTGIAFIISLAGTGVNGLEITKRQCRDLNNMEDATLEAQEMIFTMYDQIYALDSLQPDSICQIITHYVEQIPEDKIADYLGEYSREESISLLLQQLATPWNFYFLKNDPTIYWSQVHCPVFAVNGEKDLQVNAAINLTKIAEALEKAGNEQVKIKSYQGLNHLFQHAKTGSPAEYIEIEETFSVGVMKNMVHFIEDTYQTKSHSTLKVFLLMAIVLIFLSLFKKKK